MQRKYPRILVKFPLKVGERNQIFRAPRILLLNVVFKLFIFLGRSSQIYLIAYLPQFWKLPATGPPGPHRQAEDNFMTKS